MDDIQSVKLNVTQCKNNIIHTVIQTDDVINRGFIGSSIGEIYCKNKDFLILSTQKD